MRRYSPDSSSSFVAKQQYQQKVELLCGLILGKDTDLEINIFFSTSFFLREKDESLIYKFYFVLIKFKLMIFCDHFS
jgi:hypothetical protein